MNKKKRVLKKEFQSTKNQLGKKIEPKKLNNFSNLNMNKVFFNHSFDKADVQDAKNFIKFKNDDLNILRNTLLADLSNEYYAILLGKKEVVDQYEFINIYEIRFPKKSDYTSQQQAFLGMKKEFVFDIITEVNARYDVDVIIDVHTHPFSKQSVAFSNIDDSDEISFYDFIKDKFDNINYASIVFSQKEYSARIWKDKMEEGKSTTFFTNCLIKTQTASENIKSSDFLYKRNEEKEKSIDKKDNSSFFNRSVLALGIDNLRKITGEEVITVVGVGGLGSIISEHLVHNGFHNINLIDFDKIEVSNLNRIVGAYYEDAINERNKVDVIKDHLVKINPNVKIKAYNNKIDDIEIEKVIALSDWIIVGTDNHSSRDKCLTYSMKYFVPMISAGVSISVENDSITDMSGEVITMRVGDRYCLQCLQRINHMMIANEIHPEKFVRDELVNRGYITGKDVKEPAVKNLNTYLATMAIDSLINQYTNRQRTIPILVYENNDLPLIYEDKQSLEIRDKDCYTCCL